MAFLLHLIGMGMGLCTLVAYACIKVGLKAKETCCPSRPLPSVQTRPRLSFRWRNVLPR